MPTRHFLLTKDNTIEEFSDEQASRVAAGTDTLPQFADKRLRYVQVEFDDSVDNNGELRVRTLGAIISFDDQGRMLQAGGLDEETDELSHFEHDACVQFALKEAVPWDYALN
ncbi:MAG TPA: hypothetical protein VK110_05005 [Salinisphaeraceae bacterium]|nr:hypothetical protein [Salinisphaeraceae bacterium]